MAAIRILEYLDPQGRSPHAAWFEGLNAPAAVKITAALYQLAAGNRSNLKAVGIKEGWADYRRRKDKR
jgi:hypothetical protein